MTDRAQGKRAVVIGAGFGGLIAASSLSPYFEQVTVIERDRIPTDFGSRPHVPQSRHLHGLLARGSRAIDALHPEFRARMTSLGGHVADLVGDTRSVIDSGHERVRVAAGIPNYYASRTLVEHVLRECALNLPNVQIVDGTQVAELLVDDESRVSGVLTSSGEKYAADLVVDSSGRTAPGLAWLEKLGYEAPQEKRTRVEVLYGTRHYKRDPALFSGAVSVSVQGNDEVRRAGLMHAQEDGTWIVTLYGFFGDGPPADEAGFLEYARSLLAPDIAHAIESSLPVGEGHHFKIRETVWRDYAHARLPLGYLPFGDTICAFNPIYAQGMTVAAVEGELLRECLDAGAENLESRFLAAADQWVGQVWRRTTPVDERRLPDNGEPKRSSGLRDKVVGAIGRAGARDPQIATALMKVINMIEPESTMSSPKMLARVAWALRPRLRKH